MKTGPMKKSDNKEAPDQKRENRIFTIWVHAGYTVLILSMLSWMAYLEFFM